MPAILKPANLSLTWASGGDILNPGDTKYASGWAVEIPARQWFNYLDNRQDEAIAHINQHGVAVWDSGTEYQADKSYTQGATNGTIYRCILTHTNQNPETDLSNTYWIVAFASAGDFYTKTETDNLYLKRADNGSDILNTATFRTNLGVLAATDTYTKAEVDGKTTVASTAQAQALTSNTTLLTPLRLDQSMQGSNQSLSRNGYQRWAGGEIIQYGITPIIASGTNSVISLPMTFPNGVIGAVATYENFLADTAVGSVYVGQIRAVSTSQITIRNLGPSNAQYSFYVIGY